MFAKVISWFKCLFGRIVFAAKHRAGFIDMGLDVEFTGLAVHQDGGNNEDGDWCFEVVPDSEWAWLVRFGNRETAALGRYVGALECEVMPCQREALLPALLELKQRLTAGQLVRVRVAGRWGYDGVHDNQPEWLQVLYALWGHGPDAVNGWLEVHPVTKLEIL